MPHSDGHHNIYFFKKKMITHHIARGLGPESYDRDLRYRRGPHNTTIL